MKTSVLSKVCKVCKEEKVYCEFTRNKDSVDGIYGKCKQCVKKNKIPTELDILRKNTPEPLREWKLFP